MFFKFYGQSSSFDAVPKISLAVVCTTDRMTTCVGFCLFGPQALGAVLHAIAPDLAQYLYGLESSFIADSRA